MEFIMDLFYLEFNTLFLKTYTMQNLFFQKGKYPMKKKFDHWRLGK